MRTNRLSGTLKSDLILSARFGKPFKRQARIVSSTKNLIFPSVSFSNGCWSNLDHHLDEKSETKGKLSKLTVVANLRLE